MRFTTTRALQHSGDEQPPVSFTTALFHGLAPDGGLYVPETIEAWPDHLAPWWQDGFETFHSPAWWRDLWERDGLVRVERADAVPHGADDWLTWAEACDDWARSQGRPPYEQEAQMLHADREGLLGFTRLVASRV